MTEPPKLWAHQEKAIQEALRAGSYMLALETGTGKTRTAIEILKRIANERQHLLRTIIFAPPIVLSNWQNEWYKYTKIERSKVTVLAGSGKKRLELFQDCGWSKYGSAIGHVFVTNYEALLMEPLFEAMMKWKPEAIVFDESHRISNYKAKRSKLADKLANKTTPRPLVYMLSGTPITNSMMDIFQQFKVMDGGETFGSNFFAFRSKYFRDKNASMNRQNYFPHWIPLPNSAQELSEKMKARSIRVKKSECLDLPPVVEQIISVEMEPEQARIYKSMLKDFVAFFEREGKDHAVMANMALVKGLRLLQISSGFIKTDQGDELSATKGWSPKQEALAELLEDLQGQKVLIWATFTYNYKQIRDVLEKLGIKYLELNGEMGPKKNRESAALFEASNEYQAIIAHPESAGEGVSLISAPTMISFSRDFSWRRWEQAVARNYRGGSEVHEKITRYVLVSKDTIEEKVTEKLLAKEEISAQTLGEITFSATRI